MHILSYLLVYPIIYLVSLSPFWLLYRISDFLYFVIYFVAGYRKKVVLKNIRNSFPESSEGEVREICRKFYVFLCDLILESLKTITWNEQHVTRRVKVNGVETLNRLFDEHKSILIVMGHLGNWEWAGPGFSLTCKHTLHVVYRPLSNPFFENVFKKARTKFNTKIIPRENTLRSMLANRGEITATALIADQAPAPIKSAHWMKFLSQDTAVYLGPEKLAKKLGYPVVYIRINRTRRGHYEVTPTVISENPKETEDLEITEAFNRKLEEDILKQPESWLWSHKRWKHKKPK